MAGQEYITNKLQKQVDQLASEKRALQHEKVDLQRQVRAYHPCDKHPCLQWTKLPCVLIFPEPLLPHRS